MRQQPLVVAVCWKRDSEDLLVSLIDEWKARGRPSEDNLEIRVSFRNEHSTLRHLWKAPAKR